MMELRYDTAIYQFDPKIGGFEWITGRVIHSDIPLSAKEFFDKMIEDVDDMSNKFFIMRVESTYDDMFNFYTIRTAKTGSIEYINMIGPNNYDESMLVDAILGCDPTKEFVDKCNDRIIDKIVYQCDGKNYEWAKDARDRLKKVNPIRLKEIYNKIKS